MRNLCCFVLLLFWTVSGYAQANATEFTPDSFFIAKEKEVWEALKNKGKAAAERLLADDFVGMYDFGFFTKPEWVKQLDDQYTVDAYTIENAKVLHPSPNTALLLYTSNCKGTGAWAEYCSHASRISDLWVERNGQWLALFSQDTQATSSQPLPHDDLEGNSRVEHPTGKEAVETVPGPSAVTTLVNSDVHPKFTPFEDLIIGKEKEAIEAVEKNDLKHFATLLADDFLFIDENGFWGKREYLKSFEEDVTWKDCKMEDVRVSSSGENAAIISYKQTWTGSDHGKEFKIVIYTHGHWEKRRGQWMVTLWQDTDAENDSAPADETKPLLTLPPSPDRSNLQTEVISHERAFLEALKRNECATASGFMSDGLMAIGGYGMKGKAEYMKLCETRQRRWTGYELEQVQVYPVRADSVILVKKVIFSGTDQGKQFKSVEYGHEDWERHNGDWQITALQDTPQAIVANDENQIIALEKRMWNGDASETSKLEAEDYEVIKHAHRYHRADDEAAAKDVKFALTSMDDIRVRMLRPDVALITYHATQKGSFRGTEVPPSLYFGSIWVNRSGEWKNVFLEENAPDVFTDIYKPSADRAQPHSSARYWVHSEPASR